jgi:hypothetical protein
VRTGKLKLSDELALPVDAVTQTFAFLARRGAGKTYTAGKLAEEMLTAGAQVVVLDPVGNWFGLRIGADARSKGFDIAVFGGRNGDIPLEPRSGRLVAQYVVDRGIPLVLDVSSFRKGQQKEFVTDFAEELFELKKANPSAVHLIVEEAQRFMPQRVWKGAERMLGAMEDLIKLGRNYGIGISLLSQRPQAVNKDCLNQTECLVVLQTTGSQERRAIKDWIVEKDIDVEAALDELPSLPIGTAYVWSPQWLGILKKIRIGTKQTFDASATPKLGEKRTPPKSLTREDLDRIRADMKDMVKRAEESDPKALKAEVVKLRIELDKAQKAALAWQTKAEKEAETRVVEKVVERPVLKSEDLKILTTVASRMSSDAANLDGVGRSILAALEAVRQASTRPAKSPALPEKARMLPVGARMLPARSPTRSSNGRARDGSNGVPKGARDMLAALAGQHPTPLTKRQLATLAGLKPTGGSFRTYLSLLRTYGTEDGSEGLIEVKGDCVNLTSAGQAHAGPVTQPQTTEELVAVWISKLTGGAKEMLRALVETYPNGLAKDELAAAVHMDLGGGSFRTYLSALRSNGLAEYEDGVVRASPSLFLN